MQVIPESNIPPWLALWLVGVGLGFHSDKALEQGMRGGFVCVSKDMLLEQMRAPCRSNCSSACWSMRISVFYTKAMMQKGAPRRQAGRGADAEGPGEPVGPGPAIGCARRGRQRHAGVGRAALAVAAALDLDPGRLEQRAGTLRLCARRHRARRRPRHLLQRAGGPPNSQFLPRKI